MHWLYKINAERITHCHKEEQIKHPEASMQNPTEIKWNNVSASRLPLYKALVDYFFEAEIYFVAYW